MEIKSPVHIETSQCRMSGRGPTHNNNTEVMERQSLIPVGSVVCDGVLGVSYDKGKPCWFWLCLTGLMGALLTFVNAY